MPQITILSQPEMQAPLAVELGQLGSSLSQQVGGSTSNLKSEDVEQGQLSVREVQAPSEMPPNTQSELERWNWPRGNTGRLALASLSLFIAGMNDGAVGVQSPPSP
jgi:hypothetical protein